MTNGPGIDFTDRYAIASFSDGGGVLVDLMTGGYFRLNATATLVCSALQATADMEEAIAFLARRMQVSSAEASHFVAVVREGLSQSVPRNAPMTPLLYGRSPDGSWILEENGRPIFAIADERRQVELCVSPAGLEGPLTFYLQALVPKLLALLDIPVLHAAACRIHDRYVAFSGRSGAGKTTTALTFERGGARLLSEDLLILSIADQRILIHAGGERFARDWARQVAPTVEACPGKPLDYGSLSGAPRGELVPLDAIWFVAEERRLGSELRLRPLSVSDGALALLNNGFLASSYPRQWRDFLHRSQQIAERVELMEATMPSGLDCLESAARRYIVNSAS